MAKPNLRIFQTGHMNNQEREIERLGEDIAELEERCRTLAGAAIEDEAEIERLRDALAGLEDSHKQTVALQDATRRENVRLRELIARAKAAHDKHDYLAVHHILKAELEGERRA